MARGKAHSDETKSAVMAALLAGQSVSSVAEEFKIPLPTICTWAASHDFEEVRTKKGELIEDLTCSYLSTLLTSLRSQAEIFGKAEYLNKQPAAEAAVLHGVMADKAFRLLSAMPTGSGSPESGTEE